MEELRAHVRKYGPVMQRYYVQYLSGFDAVVLNELVQVWQDHMVLGSQLQTLKRAFCPKLLCETHPSLWILMNIIE